MLVRFNRLKQRGDTIVEVLVAIAVISLILGGAFVLTNQSLQGSRQAQERVNALKLVESQIEQIKNFAATNGPAVFGPGLPASFCINSSGVIVAAGGATCTFGVDGAAATGDPSFRISATRTTAGSIHTFTIVNTWQDVSGDHQNNVQMKYRVSP